MKKFIKKIFPLIVCSFTLQSCFQQPSNSELVSTSNSNQLSSETVTSNSTNSSLTTSNSTTTQENSSLSNSSSSIEESSSSSSKESSMQDLSAQDLSNALKNTIYTQDGLYSSQVNVNDASNMGIDQSKYDLTYYPLPEVYTSYQSEEYSITPEGDSNSTSFNNLINQIKTVSGNKVIFFKKGTYVFNSPLLLSNIDDIYLVGEEGVKFNLSNWGSYLKANECHNFHLSNIDFDMVYSPTISGTIASYNEESTTCDVVLNIPEEFDLSNSSYTSWKDSQCSYMECYYDTEAQAYVPDVNKNLFYNSSTSTNHFGVKNLSYNQSLRQLTVTLNKSFPYCSFKTPVVDTHVSFAYTMYQNSGFLFTNCEDVYIENTNTYVSGGMGFRVEKGKNFYLNKVNFKNNPLSSRIMTCTADIIHTIALQGDLKITNSILEASHDDALNIKTFYGRVTSVESAAKIITVDQTQSEVSVPFEKGDNIEIYDPETMGLTKTFQVLECSKLGNSYDLTVDSRPSSSLVGFNVGNDDKATHLELNNCLIQNKRNRGILCQSRYTTIKNCVFRNVVMGAIQILSVGDMFAEGIVPKDITVENCKFMNSYQACSVFAYGTTGKGISGTIDLVKFKNNYFYKTHQQVFSVSAASHITIENNFIELASYTNSPLIKLSNSANIEVNNNTCLVASSLDYPEFISSTSVENLNNTNNQIIRS